MRKTLKQFLETSGKTQAQLARELDIDRSAIHRWMDGSRKPSRARLKKLSKLTGISLGDLL